MALNEACPGSSRFKSPTVEYVTCPQCGADDVEMWSVDVEAQCHVCKTTVRREQPPSCILWCKMAEQCFGKEKLEQFLSLMKR